MTGRSGGLRESARDRRTTRREHVDAVVQGLRRIVKALESYSKEVESSFGLTGPQLWAVKTLEQRGPLPVSRLAEELVVHQASASILVTRLEKRGLVSRSRDNQDRRVVLISLTRAGKKLAGQAPEAAQGKLLHGLLTMSEPQVRRIRDSIDRLVVAMEAEDLEATFFFAGD